jgi:hypothetical protein
LGKLRFLVLTVAVVALGALALPSAADHGTRPITGPLTLLGDYPHVVGDEENINTDLAFKGNRAYMGLWNGFANIDISNPASPQEVLLFEDCGAGNDGNQGDLIVWENLLVRAWNSSASGTTTCDGDLVPAGFEGIHIFDISNELDPDLVGSVLTDNGAHTLTAVPDTANNRLLVYSNASSGNGFEVIEIPLANPAGATLLRTEPAAGSCHDVQVFQGDVNRVLCVGGNGTTVYSTDSADGGSPVNPRELYWFDNDRDGIGLAHAAAFTWDGKGFVVGHEPGGGVNPECDDNDREVERTLHYYDTETGELLGQWVLPNIQTSLDVCTTHNFNFIPALNGRDILVLSAYTAGTWVIDFTDPNNIQTIASADPPTLDPMILILGGAWSSYWYNGAIFESEITKGLHIFGLDTPEGSPGGFRPETISNPQTQMESIDLGTCRGSTVSLTGTNGKDTIAGTSIGDVIDGLGGRDNISGAASNDVLCGRKGKDRLKGQDGDDVLVGGPKNDKLNGGPGQDVCIGGPGKKDRASKSCEVTRSIP